MPDVPPGPDHVAAILRHADAVLFLRELGHTGAYNFLPGGFVEGDESVENACIRAAVASIAAAVRSLPKRMQINLNDSDVRLSLGAEVHKIRWDRRQHHFFAVAWASERSILEVLPQIDPKAEMWRPFEWVPINQIRTRASSVHDRAACEPADSSLWS